MPITLITGPANAGKARVVLDALRGHVARGEEPLLIVPTSADVDHYRRELAGEAAVLGVGVERFGGLIDAVVRRAAVGVPLLGAAALQQVLAAIAERSSLAAGGPIPPGLGRALVELVAELQVRRVTPASFGRALDEWAAVDPAGAPRQKLGALFAEYQATLRRMGRLDPEQRAVRALDALRRKPALWGGTPVLLYGFDDLTRLQIDTIETLGVVVGAKVMVSLTYEPGRTAFAGRAATFAALAPLADDHRELPARAEHYEPGSRGPLSHLERSLFETHAARVDPLAAVRLLEAGGEREELELVAAEVAELLREGIPPEEIAVVARSPAAIADLLEDVFSAQGIPHALKRRRPFANSAIGRALIGVLRCVPADLKSAGRAPGGTPPGGEPAGGGELADLLAWLRAPGLLERPGLADALELRARRTGASSAARARALWEERHWRLEPIDQLSEAQRTGPGALLERAARELEWLFCAPRRGSASVLEAEALDEASAFSAGRRALGELRELARVAPELAPADATELARALGALNFVCGERLAPGAVAVLDPLALRARRVRALFICGLQEGSFPARPRTQSLLAEEERRALAQTTGLRLGQREDPLAAERYLLYAAVSRPRQLLVLSWHVADDDGESTPRSLFVDDVCDLFAEDLGERSQGRGAELRAGAACGRPDGSGTSTGTSTGAAHAPIEGSNRLREEQLLADLRGHVWSASSLELWIRCPVRWFVERLLRPSAFDPDAEPLARGGLAHAALKDTLEGLRRETGSARLTPARLGLARALLQSALERNEADFPLSVRPERVAAARRRLRADLERYLSHAAEADSPLEPSWLELGFGFTGEDGREASSLPALELGGGVRLRGRVDRVDVSESGDAVVYDYKSRVAPPAAKWIEEGDLQVALYMRAVEKLLGRRVAGGFYQPLAGSDLRARGVLDADGAVGLDVVRGDAREQEQVRALVAEAVALAREAAAQAGRGELEARPRTCAYSGGCAYPTICRCAQ